jgi:hypothetical protein
MITHSHNLYVLYMNLTSHPNLPYNDQREENANAWGTELVSGLYLDPFLTLPTRIESAVQLLPSQPYVGA